MFGVAGVLFGGTGMLFGGAGVLCGGTALLFGAVAALFCAAGGLPNAFTVLASGGGGSRGAGERSEHAGNFAGYGQGDALASVSSRPPATWILECGLCNLDFGIGIF